MMFRTGYLLIVPGRGYGRRRACAGGREEDSRSLKRADGPVHVRSHMIILKPYTTFTDECLGVDRYIVIISLQFSAPLAALSLLSLLSPGFLVYCYYFYFFYFLLDFRSCFSCARRLPTGNVKRT